MNALPRIAVLGCGSIGSRHLRNLISMGYAELLAFDRNPEIALEMGKQPEVAVAGSLEEVWPWKPQVAFITSPSNLHLEHALLAAQEDCHLFVEKPLSHTLKDVDELCRQVERSGITTMVACNMRFHPGPAQVKSWLDQRVVGDILAARLQTSSYLPHWRPWQDYRESYSASPEWGGAVLDCIHEVDLSLWLLGKAKVLASVTRPATSIGLETDGLAEVILGHESGAISNLHLNYMQRNYHRAIEVIGSEGTIEWEFHSGQTKRYGTDGCISECIEQPQDWEMNQMYVDEISYFLECVQGGVPTFNSIEQAVETLKVTLQARAGK